MFFVMFYLKFLLPRRIRLTLTHGSLLILYPKATFRRHDRYDSNERLLLTRKGNSESVPRTGSGDLRRVGVPVIKSVRLPTVYVIRCAACVSLDRSDKLAAVWTEKRLRSRRSTSLPILRHSCLHGSQVFSVLPWFPPSRALSDLALFLRVTTTLLTPAD
jgi:hypothetical protein